MISLCKDDAAHIYAVKVLHELWFVKAWKCSWEKNCQCYCNKALGNCLKVTVWVGGDG